MSTPEHMECFDSITGKPDYRPTKWIDNEYIFGGRFTSKPPTPKTPRTKRDTVEDHPATPAEHRTPTTPPAGETEKE